MKRTNTGNTEVYEQLKSTQVQFDPLFEIMPGTKQKTAGKIDDALFEQDVYYTSECQTRGNRGRPGFPISIRNPVRSLA